MLLAKRGPPHVNEGSPSRACMKMAHGGVVEDSANGDGQLEDFDGDNCDGRFAYATIHNYLNCGVYPKEPSTFVLRVLTYTMLVVLQVSLQY